MFTDLFAGTGCMVLNKGSATRDVIRGFSVPITEIALENGPYGGVARHIWKRNYKARLVEEMWPNNFGKCENLAKTLKDNRNADVAVTQYHYWDHKDEVWRLCVWTDKDTDAELHCEKSSTSAFITPRMFVVPGEAMGRGIAHLGLPFVKTANKARELALRAAAFALLGLWTRRDDRVFNPDLAPMVPGAMWKVGSNGGSMGPTIQRLDVPKDFDISTIIINDERDQIRRVLLDDELPELTDRVRSPTEIAGRMRRYDRNRGGATTRLAFELIAPFVQRCGRHPGSARQGAGEPQIDDIITRAPSRRRRRRRRRPTGRAHRVVAADDGGPDGSAVHGDRRQGRRHLLRNGSRYRHRRALHPQDRRGRLPQAADGAGAARDDAGHEGSARSAGAAAARGRAGAAVHERGM